VRLSESRLERALGRQRTPAVSRPPAPESGRAAPSMVPDGRAERRVAVRPTRLLGDLQSTGPIYSFGPYTIEVDAERFRTSPIGRLQRIVVTEGSGRWEHVAFVPAPLPNSIDLERGTWNNVLAASSALSRLDGSARRLPNPSLLVRQALTEEAVSTSALEGTYAPLTDVLQADATDSTDVESSVLEVRNYIRAAERGLDLIKTLPVSLRVAREVHSVLQAGVRGDSSEVGQFRRRQNWIGVRPREPVTESLFVPPPYENVDGCLNDWERWVNRDDDIPLLVRVALAHYQFETIHPFVDGNGRIGRLIAVLMLIARGELTVPLLNLSPFFEARKDEYVGHLRETSASGDFEPWICFFSDAVREQSEDALRKADTLMALRDKMLNEVHAARLRGVGVRVVEDLIGTPIVTPTRVAAKYGVTYAAANSAVLRLVEVGLLEEVTGRSYGRLFSAPGVIRVLSP
jgi:Fic family protein